MKISFRSKVFISLATVGLAVLLSSFLTGQTNARPPRQKPSPKLKEVFQTLNHNDIEFYGRAVDQDGEPVAGAEVTGTVIVNTGAHGGEMKKKTMTDAQGYFQFGGFKGQDLGIWFKKEGYDYQAYNSSFSYSYFEADHKRHIPDQKKPVIFTLWKKKGAENLIYYEKYNDIPADGSSVGINLETGKIDEHKADLIMSIIRKPLQVRFGERGFAWKASMQVIEGGLIRLGKRDYYNLAPETGYVSSFEFVQEAQSVYDAQEGKIKWTWVDRLEDDFLISLRNGNMFAHVRFRILPSSGYKDRDNFGGVRIISWLNPNGSRNLEFDPKKVITPPR